MRHYTTESNGIISGRVTDPHITKIMSSLVGIEEKKISKMGHISLFDLV